MYPNSLKLMPADFISEFSPAPTATSTALVVNPIDEQAKKESQQHPKSVSIPLTFVKGKIQSAAVEDARIYSF